MSKIYVIMNSNAITIQTGMHRAVKEISSLTTKVATEALLSLTAKTDKDDSIVIVPTNDTIASALQCVMRGLTTSGGFDYSKATAMFLKPGTAGQTAVEIKALELLHGVKINAPVGRTKISAHYADIVPLLKNAVYKGQNIKILSYNYLRGFEVKPEITSINLEEVKAAEEAVLNKSYTFTNGKAETLADVNPNSVMNGEFFVRKVNEKLYAQRIIAGVPSDDLFNSIVDARVEDGVPKGTVTAKFTRKLNGFETVIVLAMLINKATSGGMEAVNYEGEFTFDRDTLNLLG